jgi:uncharacterized membrane protein YoaK (UPF0700 family)
MSDRRALDEMADTVRRLWPWSGSGHGPLPALLVLLTVVTGLVDAVSYLTFGHVFVANMTGNVVFLGFALAGAHGLSASASLVALCSFFLGAFLGGLVGARWGAHRGRHVRTAMGCSALLVAVAAILALAVGEPVSEPLRYTLIVILGLAMGGQNAAARRLAVPDLTTTVLTLTLTGIASDSRLAGGPGGRPSRRFISVAAMFLGALAGALLVLDGDLVLPLSIAALLMALVALAAHMLARGDPEWTKPPGSRG